MTLPNAPTRSISMLEVGLPSSLAEALRVLRPGGWMALATWGDAERNPWTAVADDAIRAIGLVPPDRRRALCAMARRPM